MSSCPYCGESAATVREEVWHMETRHPDVIRERLEGAGLREEARRFVQPLEPTYDEGLSWTALTPNQQQFLREMCRNRYVDSVHVRRSTRAGENGVELDLMVRETPR